MLQHTLQFISKHQLLTDRRNRILVALSGGADSVALLHILWQLGYPCRAAHCNFHLRGEESDRDEQFVTRLCKEWRIPLYVKHFQTTEYAQAKGISIEMAARELRYEWFEEMRQEHECKAIAVAHHQNDQAETLLLNLLRGTGLRGLEGMHPKQGFIIRPLLSSTRQNILDYLRIQHIDFVEDSTNTDTTFQRNAIRQQLQQCSEAQIAHIANTCHIMQDYETLINAYTQKLSKSIVRHTKKATIIDIPKLLEQPAPNILLYELLRPYAFPQTEQIFTALTKQSGKCFYADNYVATIDRNRLLITKTKEEEEKIPQLFTSVRDRYPMEVYLKPQAMEALFDARITEKRLTIRHYQTGDKFVPIGMKGKKKLSDFLTDMKVPLTEKKKVWVLCADEEIVWVIGYRIADIYKITEQTTQVAHLRIKK